ncbi:MAG: DUF4954 family protein [Candidatus Neomarinimicrobiota bacterium]
MGYRNLTQVEIGTLENNGCRAENWDWIKVNTNFNSARIRNVSFDGKVEIGNFDGATEVKPGCLKNYGLYDSYIRNCTIADNVYIANVKNLVSYVVEEDVIIENVDDLIVTGETAFGNGTELEILNEGGGRVLSIYDRLTAQIAYLVTVYRHDKVLQTALAAMIDDYIATQKSNRGLIAKGVRIYNSNVLRNLRIGEKAVISGALLLEDGTIASCGADPAFIGEGVTARHFIVLSGSRVEGSVMLDKCFIGQGVRLGKQFSAENSAFFANCEGFHGEAVATFAGPYTVTHHKSTLLIAGMFSFFNAGSGTNQSNHMYKLGPLHQGIMERGSKTGSFSYQLWPARIGAFSVVTGKHYGNADTADLPFSYLTEKEGKSILTPAMNLLTVGTRRDSAKWPVRDRRKDTDKLDLLNFDFLSPYLIKKILRGIDVLKNLEETSRKDQEYVNYQGTQIKRLMLKGCSRYYDMALKIFFGNMVMKKIDLLDNISWNNVRDMFSGLPEESVDNWIDLAGMLATDAELTETTMAIKQNKVNSVTMLEKALAQIHRNYDKSSWQFCLNLLLKRFATNALSVGQVCQVLNEWQENVVRLNSLIIKDAEKEFDHGSRIGYGLDGDDTVRDLDFAAVRGTLDDNKFILELKKESEQIVARAGLVIAALIRETGNRKIPSGKSPTGIDEIVI